MKLLGLLLRTRTRIFVGLALTVSVMVLYLNWAVPWMEETSTSIGNNLLVILFWMLQGTLIAFYASVLAGDQIFGKGWRSQMFEHVPLEFTDADLELGVLSKKIRARTFQFSFLYTLCAVLVFLTSNYVAGDFFGHYQKVSYYKTIFRGEKEDLKIEALEKLGGSWGPDLVERTPIVLEVYEGQEDPVLKEKALDAITGIAYTVRAAANPNSHPSAGKASEWKHSVSRLIRDQVLDSMQGILGSSKNLEERSRAWMILSTVAPGALLSQARTVEDRLLGEKDRVTMILGLTWLGYQETLEIFKTEISESRHAKTRIAALWALGLFFETYEAPRANDGVPDESVQEALDLVAEVMKDPNLDIRCAALDSLGKAGDARLLSNFLEIMESSASEERCVTQEIKVPNRRPELIYRESTLRFRALEAIASITQGNKKATDALKAILGSEKYRKSEEDKLFLRQVKDVLKRAGGS